MPNASYRSWFSQTFSRAFTKIFQFDFCFWWVTYIRDTVPSFCPVMLHSDSAEFCNIKKFLSYTYSFKTLCQNHWKSPCESSLGRPWRHIPGPLREMFGACSVSLWKRGGNKAFSTDRTPWCWIPPNTQAVDKEINILVLFLSMQHPTACLWEVIRPQWWRRRT